MDNKKEYYSYVEELYKEAAGRSSIVVKNNSLEIIEFYKFDKIIGKSNVIPINFYERSIPPKNQTIKIQL